MLTAVMAAGQALFGSGSMTEEFHAGVKAAVHHPQMNTNDKTESALSMPTNMSSASKAQTTT